MFIKQARKTNLVENFEKAKEVKKKMLTLVGNLGEEDNKTLIVAKKIILLTKIAKKDPTGLKSVHKIIKNCLINWLI
jgi:hypothetical protein